MMDELIPVNLRLLPGYGMCLYHSPQKTRPAQRQPACYADNIRRSLPPEPQT